jgi:WhiB family redox-sensing transcriptional regulator
VTEIYREVSPLHDGVGESAGAGVSVGAVPGVVDDAELVFPLDVEAELRWQDRALCAQTDPEAFFPEKGGSTREAKRVCTTCPVRTECLEYALASDERFGIWGGLSERERRRLKRRVS